MNWKSRFDKEYSFIEEDLREYQKVFIRGLLEQERQEIIEWAEKEIKQKKEWKSKTRYGEGFCIGVISTCEKLLTHLKSKE